MKASISINGAKFTGFDNIKPNSVFAIRMSAAMKQNPEELDRVARLIKDAEKHPNIESIILRLDIRKTAGKSTIENTFTSTVQNPESREQAWSIVDQLPQTNIVSENLAYLGFTSEEKELLKNL